MINPLRAVLVYWAAVTTKLTVVVRLPPMFSVANVLAPSTWQSPARPVTCLLASCSMRTPVAPTGCPTPIRPPLGLTGIDPVRSSSPF
jgi:hypothetical protein